MGSTLNCCLVVFLIVVATGSGLSSSDYNKWFEGEGTYFGQDKKEEDLWEYGNCALRGPRPSSFYNYVPVAMNNVQYQGMCGACLEVEGSGEGSGDDPITGTFRAMVMDQCPECKKGDIDLGKDGDGRWNVKWRVVPCTNEGDIEFQFEGSNPYYHKVQPRNLKSPPAKVTIDGIKAEFKPDNHWVANNGNRFKETTKIEVWTVLGAHITAYVKWIERGVVRPSKVEDGDGSSDDSEPVTKVTPAPRSTPTPTATPTPSPKSTPPSTRKVSNRHCRGQYSYCGYGRPWGGVSNACCAEGTRCIQRANSKNYFCFPSA